MDLLDNVIQPYAWGSRTAIAEMLGQSSPSQGCQAELWMGAHPGGPSRLRRSSAVRTLLEAIQSAPEWELGPVVTRRFGKDLPFRLKVLAAEQPLSLQTHPSLAQAREGYARENQLGIPLNAPHRNYKDANHKPELLCALTPVEALCGFRHPGETLALFDTLGLPALEPLLAPLRASPDARGLARTFEALMTLPQERRRPLVDAVVAACATHSRHGGPFRDELLQVVRLGAIYPGDPGVVGALLLNLVRLRPGEALYLSAGNLHAYLGGVGVEIMANSDNVLRGGCTPKHVDVPELLRVLDFHCGPVDVLSALPGEHGESVYPTPSEEFRLSRFSLRPGAPARPERRGPEILLCAEGSARLRLGADTLALPRGASVFVGAAEGPYTLDGEGLVFRATSGL